MAGSSWAYMVARYGATTKSKEGFSMKRIYVAGGMSGHYLFQFEAFDRARDALAEQGWDVVSPADLDRADGYDPVKNPDAEPLEYGYCMERDERYITGCTAMCFLPGWEVSKGAQREKQKAEELGLEMYLCVWKGAKLSLHPMEQIPYGTRTVTADPPTPAEGLRLDTGKPRVELEDSGERREAESGAVRDRARGKGRYDLITPLGLKRLAIHYENGAIKYADRNWEKGFPLSWFFDSMSRHCDDYMECRVLGEEPKEDHLAAVAWNALGFIHTEEMIRRGKLPAELDDLPNPKGTDDRPKETT